MRVFILTLALWLGCTSVEAQASEIPDWLRNYNFEPPRVCDSNPAGPLDTKVLDGRCPLLVDDEIALAQHSWHPWTYPPVCIQPEKASDSKLCVFSYTKLRGEQGISLITTPDIAAGGIGILEDPNPIWEAWARSQPLAVSEPPPYEVRDLGDRGKGVIANRTIRRDEVVMLRYPVLVKIMDPRPWKHQDVMKLLHRAAVQLPPKEALQMMQLAHSKGGYIVDDVINTNAFGVLINDADHSGLYLDVSVSAKPSLLCLQRLNHACKPNMFSRFSSTTLGMEVVAYRDIEPGEELTFSCKSDLPLNLQSEQRQSLIQEWGFNCTCSLCASPKAATVSDRQRSRIQELLEELDRPETHTHSAIEKRVAEILDLCEKEALAAQVGDLYTIVAEVYSGIGDLDSAARYGKRAVKELVHYAGYDHDRTKSALLFLENLRGKVHA
ncbi:hypothetical protein M426DRAFT_70346 [Hypoxylon sp. CI-4A]|nr:hypothetical protein M426DRAFT_70346 [Hypoxylon sp. CI-4A]